MSSEPGAREELTRTVGLLREARRDGRLRQAVAALDAALSLLDPHDTAATRGLADEGAILGQALEEKGAPLAALSEYLRATDLVAGHARAEAGVERGLKSYSSWRPPLIAIGPRDQLLAGATGAFWLGRSTKARAIVLKGGITSETIAPARNALARASEEVLWLFADMKELGYVGSTGIAAAVKAAEGLEQRGGGLVLFSVASNLGVVIETLGLAQHLQVATDLGAALAVARRPRGAPSGGARVPRFDVGDASDI